jgi:alanyl-tRNA synthetase
MTGQHVPTERLYYTDSALRCFDATVVDSGVVDGLHEVVLDRTAFYPTSGGQPFDTGRLAGIPVVEVRDDDAGRVVHVVAAPIPAGASVQGEIDWPRRLDHMQQHTGQHLLSAAFDRLFGVRTESFHMGADASTIDLARDVTAAEVAAAEAEANRIVWEDHGVEVRFVTSEEASALPLRKAPARAGRLRLVEIAGVDLSACGGTHVPRTGVVGLIAVTGAERFKGATRVTFACGGRALASHRLLRDVVQGATRQLSTTPDGVGAALQRLQTDAKAAIRTARRLQDAIAVYRGAELRGEAATIGRHRAGIGREPDLDAGGLKGLAVAIVADSPIVAALVGTGHPAPLVIARGPEADLDAAALLRAVLAALGGRGGGTPDMAQGGAAAEPDVVLDTVRAMLSRSPG